MDTTTRSLHLIDVENLVGSGHPTARDLATVYQLYMDLDLIENDDHVVVACNPYIAVEVGDAFAPARLRVAHGPSGADHELVDITRYERVAQRFGRVVIASGDGVFTDVTVRLQAAGVHVVVVTRRDALALRLRMAATEVVYLPVPPTPAVAARRAA